MHYGLLKIVGFCDERIDCNLIYDCGRATSFHPHIHIRQTLFYTENQLSHIYIVDV